MNEIRLKTTVNAPIESVFNAARDIDAHQLSTHQTNETAIAGRLSGLIELNETVTWRGKHFGFYLTHQSSITAMTFPSYFVDEMIAGHFRYFRHEHYFTVDKGGTVMLDVIRYEAPFGIIGRLFDKLLLRKHLKDLIEKRNAVLKTIAEKQ